MSESFKYIESVERTDIGRKRKNNEDSLISLPEYGVYCVADGMGGAQDGEIASQAVVDAIEERFVAGSDAAYAVTAAASAKVMAMALNKASSWIEQRSQQRGIQGCGSTAVAMVFDKMVPERAVVVHAGDSRAYQYRDRRLNQITVDHSVASEAGISDEKDLPPMLRGVITRAVGLMPRVKVDETPVKIAPDDIYMLCSDGLSRMLSDKQIAAVFKKHGKGELRKLVDHLVDSALDAGGKDNISVILLRVASKLPTADKQEIPAETRRLENLRLNGDGDESLTAETAGHSEEQGAAPTAESDGGVMECVTPGSGSGEFEQHTVTDNSPAPSDKRGMRKVLLILLLLLLVGVAAAFYFLR